MNERANSRVKKKNKAFKDQLDQFFTYDDDSDDDRDY